MTETWKAIPGFKDYEASSLARIRSLKAPRRTRSPDGVLRPSTCNGYRGVALFHHGRQVFRRVGWLVCSAFHGERPGDDYDVDHIDQDPQNDRPENLRWLVHLLHLRRHRIRRRLNDVIAARSVLNGWNAGASRLDLLCRDHGITARRLRALLRSEANLPELRRPLPRRATVIKLTAGDVAAIRDALKSGAVARRLAERYGVHEAMISRIKSGYRWGDADPRGQTARRPPG